MTLYLAKLINLLSQLKFIIGNLIAFQRRFSLETFFQLSLERSSTLMLLHGYSNHYVIDFVLKFDWTSSITGFLT